MEKNRLRRKSGAVRQNSIIYENVIKKLSLNFCFHKEHVNQVIALGDFPDLMEHEEKVFRMMARRISFA